MKLFYMDSGAEIIGIARAYLFTDSSGSFRENSATRTPVRNREQKPKN